MSSAPQTQPIPSRHRRLGIAWLALCAGLSLHVTDEALTGFLNVYNPTVREIGFRTGFHPPTFEFRSWLGGLIFAICAMFALTPFAFANAKAWRGVAWGVAPIMALNGIAHVLGTITGRTFADITFVRPMPGFWSAPVIFATALWVIRELANSSE